MTDALMAAYADVSEAIIQLREMRASSGGPLWQARGAQAAALRAARELVASARARLAALAATNAVPRAALERIDASLLAVQQRPFELEDALSQGATHELERVLIQLRTLILADPLGHLRRAQLEACDRERQAREESRATRRHQPHPFVWLGLIMLLLIVARMLLTRDP